MSKKDFVISFFAQTPFLKSFLDELETPYVLFQPDVQNRQYKQFVQGTAGGSVLGLWNLAKKAGDELGRVAVIGFSEGCQGVRAVLETKDASAIDAVIPVDGIHSQKLGPTVEMGFLGPYISYGRLASASPPSTNPDTKLLVITHSSIGKASLPAGTVSTTETAEIIWNEVLKSTPPNAESALCGTCPAAIHQANLAGIRWPNGFPVGTVVGPGTITPNGWATVRPSAQET